MYECLAWAYHHPQADRGTRQELEKAEKAYRVAFEVAQFLSRHIVLKVASSLL
jgi:hypothetical protein